VIVRWGLAELQPLLAGLGSERPFVIASDRWDHVAPPGTRWRQVPADRIDVPADADAVVAIGGGSAIDMGKRVSAGGLPLASLPTTYSGAEWTTFYGVRDPERRMTGGGAGANPVAIVYEPQLTLGLPLEETVGTALNALAHAAEALYVEQRNEEADGHAVEGARLIGEWLPQVVRRPDDLEARTQLLRGAAEAGAALGASFLGLGHAIAQALGGRYGLPHGAMNALSLPPALRFNEPVAPAAVARFSDALGAEDGAERVEELARLGGFGRLRDFGVPAEELRQVADAVVGRAGAKANPRAATSDEVLELLHSIW
jgi:maleylacetate reductase